jgi:hypothetical protein
MVLVIGSIKLGLEQKMLKTTSYQLNYLGTFTLNEMRLGENVKMNY